ncbi:MAG: thio(seleno)oxazole modification radical SAM maturase SbtM [Fibrobacterota bacterium]
MNYPYPINFSLNPTVRIFPEENGSGFLISFRPYGSSREEIRPADDKDLTALKIISEDISLEEAARAAGVSPSRVFQIMMDVRKRAIITGPRSEIIRDNSVYSDPDSVRRHLLSDDTFSLQWHITNRCDLNCRHCYDRDTPDSLNMETAVKVLDNLEELCFEKKTRGHISFSGGNPYLSPHFFEIYKMAADRGFSSSILGNPVSDKVIKKTINIAKPTFFQVSLEGLSETNDYIRGEGFFNKVMDFLKVLRENNISSAVMLTLTEKNIDEVIPLARFLKGRTDHFTYNRLSLEGHGSSLSAALKEKYREFAADYVEYAEKNEHAGYKDNLLNIELEKRGRFFDGCTGSGCGAAWNFFALLPDSRVFACRKFTSPIGNIENKSLIDIYESEKAKAYRRGAFECSGCRIRHICGGCMAATAGEGMDFLVKKDPYCFIQP